MVLTYCLVFQLLYNRDLGQVVTMCTESVLKVWEMESGKLVYTITDSHGPNIEVTAVTLDSSGYRLATGAFDGGYNNFRKILDKFK